MLFLRPQAVDMAHPVAAVRQLLDRRHVRQVMAFTTMSVDEDLSQAFCAAQPILLALAREVGHGVVSFADVWPWWSQASASLGVWSEDGSLAGRCA